jgi:spore maturation protein CgeB
MRWLVVLPFERPGHMGVDFRDELAGMGHDVRTFAYRRENPLYKNKGTKAAYQKWILRRLARACALWRPSCVLVIKGGPITPDFIRLAKGKWDPLFLNVFPDNPLWMIPFECIEAYDVFFTKERYALRALEAVGLRNLYYLPHYCVPDFHHSVRLSPEEERRYTTPISLVGSWYPYRERLMTSLANYPIRIWGSGWQRSVAPAVRHMIAGGAVWGRAKLAVYAASTVSLNPHHPMNDIVGVNTRTFELAASGVCQLVDLKGELPSLFTPDEEVVAYRDLEELKTQLDHYAAHPDEARAIGAGAQRRALKEHTLRHRVDEILAVVEQRFGRK